MTSSEQYMKQYLAEWP